MSSGLRNPEAAVRGVGAVAFAAEGLALLLAIQPIRMLGATGLAIGVMVTLAVVCLALAVLLRARGWAWYAGPALQVVLLVCGYAFHAALAVLAVIFGLLWTYLFHVRRAIMR